MKIIHRKIALKFVLSLGDHNLHVVSECEIWLLSLFWSSLTWSSHISHLCNRCNSVIILLKYVSTTQWEADTTTMLLLHNALILSRLDYGCQVSMSVSESHRVKLDRIQSRALRVYTGTLVTTPISAPRFDCSDMPFFPQRQIIALK